MAEFAGTCAPCSAGSAAVACTSGRACAPCSAGRDLQEELVSDI